MQNRTRLHRRAGVQARGGSRLTNQVSNEEILRGSTPLCLAERLAEIYSLLEMFGYVFEIVVPPHGHWFLSKASVNTPTQAITTA
jgi:hypothetical protein